MTAKSERAKRKATTFIPWPWHYKMRFTKARLLFHAWVACARVTVALTFQKQAGSNFIYAVKSPCITGSTWHMNQAGFMLRWKQSRCCSTSKCCGITPSPGGLCVQNPLRLWDCFIISHTSTYRSVNATLQYWYTYGYVVGLKYDRRYMSGGEESSDLSSHSLNEIGRQLVPVIHLEEEDDSLLPQVLTPLSDAHAVLYLRHTLH